MNQTQAVETLCKSRTEIAKQMENVVLGQSRVIDQVLITLLARGHCLIVGVPGLGKTLMVKTLAAVLGLDTKRIQFTPDLMPSDVTGAEILEEDSNTGKRTFRFNRGPVFTNLLLADEINRTPPKTQAALLEAMQERQVTASGTTLALPDPFLVLATQNPIEQEGTYPLPEAQLDRFMFCINMDYPSDDFEEKIIMETTRDASPDLKRALDSEILPSLQHTVRQTPVSRHVAAYAIRLIRATRPDGKSPVESITRWVRWGAGTRAGQYLLLAAKAHALMDGRDTPSCDDIRHYALPVLRHRITCSFAAASEGISSDDIINTILEKIEEPDYQ